MHTHILIHIPTHKEGGGGGLFVKGKRLVGGRQERVMGVNMVKVHNTFE